MITSRQIKISIVIFIILSACFVFFLISPLLKEVEKDSSGPFLQKVDLISLNVKIEDLENFKIFTAQNQEGLERINNLFLDPEVPVDFINFLEKLAKDCSLFFEVSSLSKDSVKNPWSSLVINSVSFGSFPDFLRFLEKLESSNYLIEIQSLNIKRLNEAELKSSTKENLSVGDVQVNLSIKVYSQ